MRRHKKTHMATASPSVPQSSSVLPAPAIIAFNPPPHVGPTLQGSTTSGVLDAQVLPSSALDVPRSGLEHHLPEYLQRRNQNIREKMTAYSEVCRVSGDSPGQIQRMTGIMAGQLYLPSPLSSHPNCPQSCPIEPNSQRPQEPFSQTPNQGSTLQVDAPTSSSSSPAQQTVSPASSFQESVLAIWVQLGLN